MRGRLGRRLNELVARGDALQVADDDLRLGRRPPAPSTKSHLVQVGLVADADQLGEADAARRRPSRGSPCTARPDCEMTEMPPGRGICLANEAFIRWWVLIRPRQLGPSSRAWCAAQAGDLAFQRGALLADLLEPGRDHADRPGPGGERLVHRRADRGRGDGDDAQIDGFAAAFSEGKQGRSRIVSAVGLTGTMVP